MAAALLSRGIPLSAIIPGSSGTSLQIVRTPSSFLPGVAGLQAQGGACRPRLPNTFSVRAQETDLQTVTGVIFEPFVEVQGQLQKVPEETNLSLARHRFATSCEAALNEQINVEYNNSYIYHALFSYFDRDNVALAGFAEFFRRSSVEEREHAEALMEYQNTRGGRVKFQSILAPNLELENAQKGDALYAMELALCLEKLTNEKLLALHKTADEANDPQLTDFIEGDFLEEQVRSIKEISEYVAQLRRVGPGLGVWEFDRQLQAKFAPANGAA